MATSGYYSGDYLYTPADNWWLEQIGQPGVSTTSTTDGSTAHPGYLGLPESTTSTPEVSIPEGTFATNTSESYTGLPNYASDFMKNIMNSITTPSINTINTANNFLSGFKPFDWVSNMGSNLDFFSGQAQGTRNQLLNTLQDTLRQNTSAAGANLAARGLAPMLAGAAPQIARQALSDYATAMAGTDLQAAQLAGSLAAQQQTGATNEYSTMASLLTNLLSGLAGLGATTRESRSTSYSGDPLEPYKLMLGQWS